MYDTFVNLINLMRPTTAKMRPVTAKPVLKLDGEEVKTEFLEKVEESKVETEEAFNFNMRARKLENIELIEKGNDDIYEWKELFSKKRSLSSYTKINDLEITQNNKKKEIFSIPVALIDKSQEKIRDIFDYDMKKETRNEYGFSKLSCKNANLHKLEKCTCYKKSQSENKLKSVTRTRLNSVYQERNLSEIYFLNKEYSEYFKMDLKEFAERFSLLHPKLRIDKRNITKMLHIIKQMNYINDNLLRSTKEDSDVKINKRLLFLASNSKNIYPLLKSIYLQMYPDAIIENSLTPKMYLNSNKPLGNDKQDVDYTINMRNSNMSQFSTTRKGRSISTGIYDENDPDIICFSEIGENVIVSDEDVKNYFETNISNFRLNYKITFNRDENNDIYDEYKISEAYRSSEEDYVDNLNKETQTIKVEDTYEDRTHRNVLSTSNIHTSTGIKPIRELTSANKSARPQTAINRNIQPKRYTESIKELQLSNLPSDKISELEESDTHSHSNAVKSRVGSGRPTSRGGNGPLYHYPIKAKKPVKIGDSVREINSKFEDAVIINKIPDIRNTFTSRYDELTHSKQQRPQTSTFRGKTFRPISAKRDIMLPKERNQYKESNVNNLYFNQYIDIQFDKIGLLNALQKKKENVNKT
jgi:hypothetical protein